MPLLSCGGPAVPPSFAAGLLLASLPLLATLDLPHPTATAVIEAVGVSRSRAYEVKASVEAAMTDLVRPPGRPPAPAAEPAPDAGAVLSRELLRYVMDHPGCVHGGTDRRRYSDGFRLFVLDLCEQHKDLDLTAFAEAAEIPPGTLRDWLRGGRDAIVNLDPVNLAKRPTDNAKGPRIESILAAYKTWQGAFDKFCDHVQLHLRIPWGRTTISRRIPLVRHHRRSDLHLNAVCMDLELNVDTHTGALVGMSLRDTEDGAAVAEAFADSVATTGAPPIAQLLDNRHSNHTDELIDALGDTLKIRRTQGRPQNGAHVEGAFGLFQQIAPDIVLDTSDERELARQALLLVVLSWARTLNHRPQVDKDGRSRVRRYTEDAPTPEEIEAASKHLEELHRKQEKARLTRQARLDPVRREILDQFFERLDLLDPDGNVRDAIAGFPLDSILAGLAIFEAKLERGTLPDGVDARYLLGIVRRIADEDEGIAFAETLWQDRRAAGDLVLLRLDGQREEYEEDALDPMDLVRRFIDLAMATDRTLDRAFWLRAVADTIEAEPPAEHRTMFLVAARRIHATHRIPKKQRNAATRRLATMVQPIA